MIAARCASVMGGSGKVFHVSLAHQVDLDATRGEHSQTELFGERSALRGGRSDEDPADRECRAVGPPQGETRIGALDRGDGIRLEDDDLRGDAAEHRRLHRGVLAAADDRTAQSHST